RRIDNSAHIERLRAVVQGQPAWTGTNPLAKRLWQVERAFYEARGYMPAWVDGDLAAPQWVDLVQQLKYSARHGLEPATYRLEDFETFSEQARAQNGGRFPRESVPEMDAKMTFAYL